MSTQTPLRRNPPLPAPARPHDARMPTPAVALRHYLLAVAGRAPASSLLEIRSRRLTGHGMEQVFTPARELDRAARVIVNRGQLSDTYVGVAPRVRPEGHVGAIEHVWLLWVDCDSEQSVERLARFDPGPSIVVRSGSGGAHGYWPLLEPLSPSHAQRANRRLALAVGADMNCTDGARVLRPPQTSNFKHAPAREVVCTRLLGQRFSVSAVVSGLPDSHHYRPVCRVLRGQRAPAAARPERVLAGLERSVAQAREGGRNATLHWACCRAVEHADAGTLDERQALDVLSMAALEAGLDGAEIRATIGSAQRGTRRAVA